MSAGRRTKGRRRALVAAPVRDESCGVCSTADHLSNAPSLSVDGNEKENEACHEERASATGTETLWYCQHHMFSLKGCEWRWHRLVAAPKCEAAPAGQHSGGSGRTAARSPWLLPSSSLFPRLESERSRGAPVGTSEVFVSQVSYFTLRETIYTKVCLVGRRPSNGVFALQFCDANARRQNRRQKCCRESTEPSSRRLDGIRRLRRRYWKPLVAAAGIRHQPRSVPEVWVATA